MRIIAFGAEAEGVIAIGQSATGFFALGQVATGVIAVGQIARGVIAVGQVAIGIASVGMLACGLVWAAGLGAGGRAGPGAILPLVPVPPKTPQLPARTTLDAIVASRAEGWIDVVIRTGPSGLEILHQGTVVPATLSPTLMAGALTHARLGGQAVALVVPSSEGLRITRLIAYPKNFGPLFMVLQIGLLFVAAFLFWKFYLIDMIDWLLREARAGLVAGGLVDLALDVGARTHA